MVGQEFAGYRIVRVLGAGGMGEVYLAQHPRLPRLDALKVLPTNLSADEAFRRRFTREAELAARLDHPNVVSVYDRGEFDGQLWITMRYVEGQDAAELLSAHPRGLPIEEANHIVAAVADALDHAHGNNLLHRDVKPANILLANAGAGAPRRVLLADFGIARPILDDTKLTATNLTVGSFAYSSPEQLSAEQLDGRADQYSLACTAYQLLSGATPFTNTNAAALIRQHMAETPPPVTSRRPDLSPRVDQVLGRALEKEPASRYLSCTEFATELNAALTTPPAAPTITPPPAVAHPATPSPETATTTPGIAAAQVNSSGPGAAAQSQPGRLSTPGLRSTPGHPPLPPAAGGVTPHPYAAPAQAQPQSAQPQSAQPQSHQPLSYQSAYPRASAYPTPSYRAAGLPQPDPKARNYATWSLICGLVSFVAVFLIIGGFVTGALALFLGISSLKMSKARTDIPPSMNNRGVAIAGIIIGSIGLVWNIAIIIAAFADSSI